MSKKALIVSILFPPLGLFLGAYGFYKDIKHFREYAFCAALCFAALAYSYTATSPTDITRHFDWIKEAGKMTFQRATNAGLYLGKAARLYGFSILCWVIGKLKMPHLLPGFTIFFVYYNAFYCFGWTCEKKQVSPKIRMLIFLFMILSVNFFSVTNNIRNIFAFSLVGLAVFRDVVQKKRDFWMLLLYVIPLGFHPTSLLLIVFRLVGLIPQTKARVLLSGFLLLVRPLLGFLENNISMFWTGPVGYYVGKLVHKGYRYFYLDSEWSEEVMASGSELVFRLLYIGMALAFFILIAVHLAKQEKRPQEGQFFTFFLLICGFAIACAPMSSPQYWRFTAMACLYSGVIFGHLYPGPKLTRQSWAILVSACFLGVVLCALWTRNILLYSDEMAMLKGSLTASPLLVVAKELIPDLKTIIP